MFRILVYLPVLSVRKYSLEEILLKNMRLYTVDPGINARTAQRNQFDVI